MSKGSGQDLPADASDARLKTKWLKEWRLMLVMLAGGFDVSNKSGRGYTS